MLLKFTINSSTHIVDTGLLRNILSSDLVIFTSSKPQKLVALRYDTQKDKAPFLICKIEENMVEKVLNIARENRIAKIEVEELTNRLYLKGMIGRYVDEDYYSSLAEIYAYIQKVK